MRMRAFCILYLRFFFLCQYTKRPTTNEKLGSIADYWFYILVYLFYFIFFFEQFMLFCLTGEDTEKNNFIFRCVCRPFKKLYCIVDLNVFGHFSNNIIAHLPVKWKQSRKKTTQFMDEKQPILHFTNLQIT